MATHKRSHGLRNAAIATGVAGAAAAALFASNIAGAAAPAEGTVHGLGAPGAVAGSFVVILDASANKADLAKKYGGTLVRSYGSEVNGFSASGLSVEEAKRLAADPAVGTVVQNKRFSIKETQEKPRPGAWTGSTRPTRRATRSTPTPTTAARA